MTFDDAQGSPDQEFELVHDIEGTIEYATKVVTFSSVHHLSLYFPTDHHKMRLLLLTDSNICDVCL